MDFLDSPKTCFKCAGTGTPPPYFEARDFNAEGQCALCAGEGVIPGTTCFQGPGYVLMQVPESALAESPAKGTFFPELTASEVRRWFSDPEIIQRYAKKTVNPAYFGQIRLHEGNAPRLPHMIDPERVGGIPPGVGSHGPVPRPPLGTSAPSA